MYHWHQLLIIMPEYKFNFRQYLPVCIFMKFEFMGNLGDQMETKCVMHRHR